jgi:hypothetical protein
VTAAAAAGQVDHQQSYCLSRLTYAYMSRDLAAINRRFHPHFGSYIGNLCRNMLPVWGADDMLIGQLLVALATHHVLINCHHVMQSNSNQTACSSQ